MNDIYKRALTSAAFGTALGATFVGYGLAESQGDNSQNATQVFGQSLVYVSGILLGSATIGLVGSLVGCFTQLVGAYNLYKTTHRNEYVAKKQLMEMEITDYASNV